MASLPPVTPLLLVLTGPSGVGKTTLVGRLLQAAGGQMDRVITATTRPRREGEIDGRDYHFLDPHTFRERIARGDFLEYAEVHGKLYGTPLASVTEPLQSGRDLIVSVDIQGAESFRQRAAADSRLQESLVRVFVLPPDPDTLRHRLETRGTDSEAMIEQRLTTALREMAHWPKFDYCFVSGSRDEDFRHLQAIYLAEKARVRTPANP